MSKVNSHLTSVSGRFPPVRTQKGKTQERKLKMSRKDPRGTRERIPLKSRHTHGLSENSGDSRFSRFFGPKTEQDHDSPDK